MPTEKSKTPSDPIRKGLEKATRNLLIAAHMPSGLAKLSAYDLYGTFVAGTGSARVKGWLASGYGETGVDASVEVGVGLSFLPIKGLLDVEATVGGEFEWDKILILALHRSAPQVMTSAATQSELWRTGAPLSFMQIRGVSKKGGGIIGITAGISKEYASLPYTNGILATSTVTDLPLQLGIGASASATAKYVHEWFYAGMTSQSYYSNNMDGDLKKAFNLALRDNENLLKQEIQIWIDLLNNQILRLNHASQQGTTPTPTDQQNMLKNIHDRIKPSGSGGTSNRNIKRTVLKLAGKAFSNFKSAIQLTTEAVEEWNSEKLQPEILITKLNQIIPKLPVDDEIQKYYEEQYTNPTTLPRQEMALAKKAMAGIRSQALLFKQKLVDFKATSTGGVLSPSVASVEDRLLCFLKMGSHEVALDTGVAASISSAGLNGLWKRAAYRYQTLSKNDKNKRLVYTQDTRITYRQVDIGVKIESILLPENWKSTLSKDTVICNSITYTSVNAYWLYPDSVSSSPILKLNTQEGSGLSFGVSVWVPDLLKYLQEIQSTSSQSTKYNQTLEALAAQLRIQQDALKDFLKGLNLARLTTDLTGIPAVLLESSIPFDSNIEVQLNKQEDTIEGKTRSIYRLAGLWDKTETPNIETFRKTLETKINHRGIDKPFTLRIRTRVADESDSSIPFKLGLSLGVSVGIQLTNIRKAGYGGVPIIRSKRYPDTPPRIADKDVPPTALFFQ